MNLMPLIPLLVMVSMALIFPVLNAIGVKRSRQFAKLGIYSYSTGLKVFLWIGSTLWISAPFCFELAGVHLSVVDWLAGAAIDVLILLCSIYAARYIVVLGSSSIRYGAFIREDVPYEQVVSMRLHISNSGTRFCDLKFSGGGSVKLDGNMPGFEELLEKLRGCVKENVVYQGFDSVAKQ